VVVQLLLKHVCPLAAADGTRCGWDDVLLLSQVDDWLEVGRHPLQSGNLVDFPRYQKTTCCLEKLLSIFAPQGGSFLAVVAKMGQSQGHPSKDGLRRAVRAFDRLLLLELPLSNLELFVQQLLADLIDLLCGLVVLGCRCVRTVFLMLRMGNL
jgi:hypothetical protein